MSVQSIQLEHQALGHWPTPLEDMRRLSAFVGGPRLLVKRDDCSGLGTGGSKTRKLEFLIAEAKAKRADTLVTIGAVQSNHSRQTAAAAAHLGLRCEIIAVDRVPLRTTEYRRSGNRLLTGLFGAIVHDFGREQDPHEALDRVATQVRDRGGHPYVVPFGGSNVTGALGYVRAANELLAQIDQLELEVDCVVHATGSGGTQAGLLAGLRAQGSSISVLGISVVEDASELSEYVLRLANETASAIATDIQICKEDVFVTGDYVGDGYGIPTPESVNAIRLIAEKEGILLDPVYTGKAMAGLLELIAEGEIDRSASVVFLHTGGSPALFSYVDDLAEQRHDKATPPTTENA